MEELLTHLWKIAPVVAILLAILWAGHKGWWHWGDSTRQVLDDTKRDRDNWKDLALKLIDKLKNGGGEKDKK